MSLALVFVRTLAITEPPLTPISWTAPEACPDLAYVEASLERLLPIERRPEVLAASVDATVSQDGELWTMTIHTIGEAATVTRRFEAEDCKALADTAALMTAIAINPLATSDQLERATVPAKSDVDADSPKSGTESATTGTAAGDAQSVGDPSDPEALEPTPGGAITTLSDTPPPESRVHYGVRPFGGAGWGALPAFGAGMGLSLFVVISWMRIEANASYWFPQQIFYEDPPNIGVMADLRAGAIRGCPTPHFGIVEIPLCVGVELGAMRGTGLGVPEVSSRNSLWAAVTAGPGLSVTVARFLAVSLGVDAVVALRRPAFHIGDRPPAHRAAPAGVRPSAGLEFKFP